MIGYGEPEILFSSPLPSLLFRLVDKAILNFHGNFAEPLLSAFRFLSVLLNFRMPVNWIPFEPSLMLVGYWPRQHWRLYASQANSVAAEGRIAELLEPAPYTSSSPSQKGRLAGF